MEVWLRGPIDGVPVLLQPVAHALLQADEEVQVMVKNLPPNLLWKQPGGMASAGFHLKHLKGVLDRLFTYATGQQLSATQLEYLKAETTTDNVAVDFLMEQFSQQVTKAIIQLKVTSEESLKERREVGRAKIASTVIGLYTHAAEHTMRHVGQLLVTTRILMAEEG